jgi:ubiquinone/menaquinone biosynthesis C-methylase UbiE
MTAGVTSARRLVADSYDRVASAFADAADHHVYRLLAVPLIEGVRRVIDVETATVLDVAAGSGAVGRGFARAIAIDSSIEQLRHNHAGPRAHADGEHLPFRTDSFAAAVCGFGVNHVASPGAFLREMARVAPVVGMSTWHRPEDRYLPKLAVQDVLARRTGRRRSEVGSVIDRYTDAVGSADAVTSLMRDAGLRPEVLVTEVEVPWPGAEAYLDYRLAMPTHAAVVDDAALRAELHAALLALPQEALTWRPRVIVGVGRR